MVVRQQEVVEALFLCHLALVAVDCRLALVVAVVALPSRHSHKPTHFLHYQEVPLLTLVLVEQVVRAELLAQSLLFLLQQVLLEVLAQPLLPHTPRYH
jgi:hypothetical protein